MTERAATDVFRDATTLRVGASAMRYEEDLLEVDIDEWSFPLPRRVVGTLKVDLGPINTHSFVLAESGQHYWRPIAPLARITVDFGAPKLKWSGSAYFDCNYGNQPLEQDFQRWDWSRARLGDGSAAVCYDVTRRHLSPLALGLHFMADGSMQPLSMPRSEAIGKSRWGLERAVRTDGASPRLIETFEDGPFYSRALVSTAVFGSEVHAVHETLCLDRFRQRWVQTLLPFRMPRMAR